MLIGGLALVPFSLCSVLHEDAYWSARRLGGLAWGIEDILFTFSVGSLIAGIGARVFQLPAMDHLDRQSFLKKYLFIGLTGMALAMLLTKAGMDIMLATITTQIAMIVVLTLKDASISGRSLTTALVYTCYYTLMIAVFFFLFPNFETYWRGTDLWPVKVAGIPLEEIVWVFTFSWSWILILLFCLGAEYQKRGDSHEPA